MVEMGRRILRASPSCLRNLLKYEGLKESAVQSFGTSRLSFRASNVVCQLNRKSELRLAYAGQAKCPWGKFKLGRGGGGGGGGGVGGEGAPKHFGQLRFFGQERTLGKFLFVFYEVIGPDF